MSSTWPVLDYHEFKSTSHLLHMGVQVIGKLKLHTPFEPHWANVALWLTSRGLTTGLIPYSSGSFSIDIDMFDHQVRILTSSGLIEKFDITSMSVAEFTHNVLTLLKKCNIHLSISMMPQEIMNPVPFDQDANTQQYNKKLAETWWRILINTYWVMRKYHSHFDGESPAIGFMWGTFDLRDARYNGVAVPTTGLNAGFIRRNAMNEAQVEIGWWPGNEAYQKPAFYSFIYPQPEGIEIVKVLPEKAHWNSTLMEFILDYDDLRQSKNPEEDLLSFFESTFQKGAKLAGWNPKLIVKGEPV